MLPYLCIFDDLGVKGKSWYETETFERGNCRKLHLELTKYFWSCILIVIPLIYSELLSQNSERSVFVLLLNANMLFSCARGCVMLFTEVAVHFPTGDPQFKCAHCYDILNFPLNKIVIYLDSTEYKAYKVLYYFETSMI